MKRFNVTGMCVGHRHYMVDISGKLDEIENLWMTIISMDENLKRGKRKPGAIYQDIIVYGVFCCFDHSK